MIPIGMDLEGKSSQLPGKMVSKCSIQQKSNGVKGSFLESFLNRRDSFEKDVAVMERPGEKWNHFMLDGRSS